MSKWSWKNSVNGLAPNGGVTNFQFVKKTQYLGKAVKLSRVKQCVPLSGYPKIEDGGINTHKKIKSRGKLLVREFRKTSKFRDETACFS